jgi:hypothetical protein
MRSLETTEQNTKVHRSDLKTLRTLIPYLWPKDNREIKFRRKFVRLTGDKQ